MCTTVCETSKKYVCPICGAAAELYDSGTVQPESYFRNAPSYAIAAAGQRERLPIYRCRVCEHGFTPVNFDPEIIVRWYAHCKADDIFLAERPGRLRTARSILRHVENFCEEKGNILDVGAGPGFFLSEASRRGWKVSGIEPAEWACNCAQRELGVDVVQQGDYRLLATFSPETLDVVTAFDVVEHLVDPAEFLVESRRVLRTGGLLVLTTPRFDSLLARCMRRKWYCIFPAHLHYFSRASLRRLLSEHGFSVVFEKRHTRHLSAGYFWRRLLHYFHRHSMQHRTSHRLRSILPVNFGDEMEVYARRDDC